MTGNTAAVTLTETVLQAGRWHGVAVRSDGSDGPPPTLTAWHQERGLGSLEITPSRIAGRWDVAFGVPAELLSDGVQVILFRDEETGETVADLTLSAGRALGEDIRAEVELLRAELDMLKQAFRRHCVETDAS